MLILGILAGLLALTLAYSVVAVRRLSFPEAYEPQPVPLDGLPPDDAQRIEAWGRSLEEKGFRRVGDFRIDLPLGRPGGISQVEQKRVWISADGTTWAAAKLLSVFNPSMEGVVRAWRMLGFTSRLPSGGLVSTHTCPALDSPFLRDPESSTAIWKGLEDVDLLLEAHRRHLRDRGTAPEASDGDLPAFERAAWRRTSDLFEAQGYLVRRDGRFHSTLKLAVRSTLRGLNPFTLERGRTAEVAARLAGTAGAAVVGAILLGGSPWTIAALFAATAAAACVLFPQSHLFSWAAVMLPAHLLLDARGADAGWGWLAGGATIVLIVPRIEAARFRRAAAALSRPDAGPPPLTRREKLAWAAALAACALAGAGALVWTRAPKETHPLALPAAALGALALSGILIAAFAASLTPSVRRSRVQRTLNGLSACALLILGGFLVGSHLADEDEKASRTAADEVLRRLERFRAENGTYPATLAELGDLPAPRCGWSPRGFTYQGPPVFGRPDWFVLSWPTDRGPASAWPAATP